jgi:hypothetical protein
MFQRQSCYDNIKKKLCDTYIIFLGFFRSLIFIITFLAEKAYFANKLQNSARENFFSIRRSLVP